MKKLVVVSVLMMMPFWVFSQRVINVRGVVGDTAARKPLPYASVVFKSLASDSVYGGAITNENGEYRCQLGPVSTDFELQINYVGYQPYVQTYKWETVKNRLFIVAMMKPLAEQLQEVEVAATHRTEDIAKISVPIDAEMLDNAVNSLDVMRKIPELQVNPLTQTAAIKGKDNTFVMLNGVMTSKSVNLRSIDPHLIEKVELINIPSGEFDNSIDGVINIVLVDNSMSMNLYTEDGWRVGKSFNSYNGIKFVRNKHSFGIDYAFETKPYEMDFGYDRQLTAQNNTYAYDAKSIKNKDKNNEIELRYDYHISDATVFSLYSDTYFYRANKYFATSTKNSVSDVIKYRLQSAYRSTPKVNNSSTVAFFKTQLNEEGLTLSFNNNFTYNKGDYSLHYADTTLAPMPSIGTRYYTDDSRYWSNNFVAKLSVPINKHSLDIGAVAYYKDYANKHSANAALSQIDYDMMKGAGFVNFSGKLKAWQYQLGLKYEAYQYHIYKRAYHDFSIQPSLHLFKKINEQRSWQISYTQKSHFPSLWQVALQSQMRDSLSVSVGNEKLKPMYVHHFSLGHKMRKGNNMLNVSLNAKYYKDMIASYYTVDEYNMMQSMPVNIDGKLSTYLGMQGSYELLEWLSLDADVRLYHEQFVQKHDDRTNFGAKGELMLYAFLPYDLVCGGMYSFQGKTLLPQGELKEDPSAFAFVGLRLFGDQGRLSLIYDFYNPHSQQLIVQDDFKQDYWSTVHMNGVWLRFNFYFFKKGERLRMQDFDKHRDLDIK